MVETVAENQITPTTQKPMTVDEFWAQYAGRRFELVKGVPQEMSPTGVSHGIVSVKIGGRLDTFVTERDLGLVVGAETGFYLAPDVLRAADAAFFAKERLAEITEPSTFASIAPDLAVEVVSPYDKASDILSKVNEYLEAGTRLVWVIYPEARKAVVHHPGGRAQTLDESAALDGEDVLPGLSIPISQLLPPRQP